MTQWLTALAALPEDVGPILSTYMAVHKHQLKGSDALSHLLGTWHTGGAQTYM